MHQGAAVAAFDVQAGTRGCDPFLRGAAKVRLKDSPVTKAG